MNNHLTTQIAKDMMGAHVGLLKEYARIVELYHKDKITLREYEARCAATLKQAARNNIAYTERMNKEIVELLTNQEPHLFI